MAEDITMDRRQYQRYPHSTNIQFLHGPTQGTCSARCVNVSAGGMMMYVSPKVPVRPGQPIRLNMGMFNRPGFSGLGEDPLDATIVRVNRGGLVEHGRLDIGVRFAKERA